MRGWGIGMWKGGGLGCGKSDALSEATHPTSDVYWMVVGLGWELE